MSSTDCGSFNQDWRTPVQVAPDGVWTWFNDRRAIFLDDDHLLFGFVTRQGRISVSCLNLVTMARSEVALGSVETVEVDDHNNPSLCQLPDGRVVAVFSRHGTGQSYHWRVSANALPQHEADWAKEKNRLTGSATTYANVICLREDGDRLFNFHRCINWNPTLSISCDLGESWRDPIHVVRTGQGRTRPYLRLASKNRDRIDIFYTDGHPNEVAQNSVYHVFYRNNMLHRSDGSVLCALSDLPLAHDDGQRGTPVYQHGTALPIDGVGRAVPGGRAWIWDAGYDRDGNPVCLFQTRRGDVSGKGWIHDRIVYHHARWTGASWVVTPVAHAGRPLYNRERDYAPGAALDPRNGDQVFLASNARYPFQALDFHAPPLAKDDRHSLFQAEIHRSSVRHRLVHSPMTGQVIRPFVAARENKAVLLWVEGAYHTYRVFETGIMGLKI